METTILNAEMRTETRKIQVKKLRNSGLVPAVCYANGKDAVTLKVNSKELYHVIHTKAGENVLITLKIAGGKTQKEKTVLIKELQVDPLKGHVIHVDFNEISLTKEIQVKVPVMTKGEAKNVTKEGGIVEHIIWEIEVECLPTSIPEKIQVDISEMSIGDTIHVKDLPIPEGVKVLNDPELVVFNGKPPVKEEEVEAVPGEEEAAEPEVIAKGKKIDEEAEGEAEESKE